MTLDERIQALTQTVERLALMHQDNEKKRVESEQLWSQRFGGMLDIVERLDTIIRIHEDRLNGHDKRLDNLERG